MTAIVINTPLHNNSLSRAAEEFACGKDNEGKADDFPFRSRRAITATGEAAWEVDDDGGADGDEGEPEYVEAAFEAACSGGTVAAPGTRAQFVVRSGVSGEKHKLSREREVGQGQAGRDDHMLPAVENVSDRRGAPDGRAGLIVPKRFSGS